MKLLPPLVTACLASALLACGPATQPPVQPTPLATASAGALEVELSTLGELAVGLNRVFYRVLEDGQPVPAPRLVQRPVMNMATMKHACPVVDPQGLPDAEGRLEGKVFFTMASSELETWDLFVDVTGDGAASPATVRFPALSVSATDARRSVTVGSVKYVVTLTLDAPAHTGLNGYTLSLHTSEQMGMRFAPVNDAEVQVTPEMPSMGHGSSGNVAPTHRGDGLYRGEASFSMRGDWVLHVKVTRGDAELGSFDFAYAL